MRYALATLLMGFTTVLLLGCGGSSERSSPASKTAYEPPVASPSSAGVRSYLRVEAKRSTSPSGMAGMSPAAMSAASTCPSDSRADATSAGAASMPAKVDVVLRETVRPREETRLDYAAPEPTTSRASQIQSGTLTAGSFDDNQRFDDYRRYLSEAMQHDPREKLPRLNLGERAVIQVENEQGLPVADARVVVKPADQSGTVCLDAMTAGDGRTMLLSGIDHAAGKGKYRVTVSAPGSANPVNLEMDIAQPLWRIRLPAVAVSPVQRLDLALVIDTTGSMGDELEYLKVEIDNIARSVRQMFPNVDQRFALVVYRDRGDQYVVRSNDFSSSLEEFRSKLSAEQAGGGGDYPEAVHLALDQATKLSWRKEGTARVLFLVGDAPPHEEFFRQSFDAVAELRRQTVRVFPVAGSGTAEQAEFIFRAMAFLTQGQYLFLTDHSGVGNPHTPPQVPDYQVERLDRLMLRMIASELAGRKLAATEVLAIEGGQSPYSRPPRILPEQQSQSSPVFQKVREPRTVSWLSAAPLSTSWLTHWSVLSAILLGKLVFDFVAERRASRPE